MRPRDTLYEDEFLQEIERVAERRFGIPATGYAERVKHRLAIGADRYGDLDFWDKDMIQELLQETPDIASHIVLEVQKRNARGLEDEGTLYHLFQCALHGCASDYHARMARRPD